jgi:hypothetical protein
MRGTLHRQSSRTYSGQWLREISPKYRPVTPFHCP